VSVARPHTPSRRFGSVAGGGPGAGCLSAAKIGTESGVRGRCEGYNICATVALRRGLIPASCCACFVYIFFVFPPVRETRDDDGYFAITVAIVDPGDWFRELDFD